MGKISFFRMRQRIDDEEEERLVRIYQSPDTPAQVLVPEAQAERILSDDSDLLKPEDVFAALLSVPEQHILKSVVLLDERDEFARVAAHPKWPPAHKSYGGGGEVCFHGVSKNDDPVAILNYHWAIQFLVMWLRNYGLRPEYAIASGIELGLDWHRAGDLEIDWATHMAGDILANRNEIFESFAARSPLRAVVLCRGLRAAVEFEGATPLADWQKRRVGYAETAVREAARRQLVAIATSDARKWTRDAAICLLLHVGEPEDFRLLAGVTSFRVVKQIFAPNNRALLAHLTSLQDVDLSFQQNDITEWLWALAQCPNVKTLNLTGSSVMSSDLCTLHFFQSLTDLDVTRTRIIDVALPYLIAKKSLKHLNIGGSEISEESIAQLRRELPACEIITGS